jgi:hypothetical protein
MMKCIELMASIDENTRVLIWTHPRMRYNVSIQKLKPWGWEDNGGSFNIPTKDQALEASIAWSKSAQRWKA